MAKNVKVGDPVKRKGSMVTYVVAVVDVNKKTADIKNPKQDAIVLHRGIPWSELDVLDQSQNAARIVREATQD